MVTVDFDRLAVKPGFKILDIGCGSGRHTCAAYQCRNVTAIGVDLNFDDLNEARGRLQLHDRLGEHGGGIWALSAADVLNLPFKDDYFDLVICSEVLEHILSYRAAIREIVRVLQPGRNLVVSVPRYWPERICWALSPDYAGSNGGHVRIFKQKQLISASDLGRRQQVGLSFCTQSAHAFLVAKMPGGARSQRRVTRQPVSPISYLGHHETTPANWLAGQTSESADGQKCGAISQENMNRAQGAGLKL